MRLRCGDQGSLFIVGTLDSILEVEVGESKIIHITAPSNLAKLSKNRTYVPLRLSKTSLAERQATAYIRPGSTTNSHYSLFEWGCRDAA